MLREFKSLIKTLSTCSQGVEGGELAWCYRFSLGKEVRPRTQLGVIWSKGTVAEFVLMKVVAIFLNLITKST